MEHKEQVAIELISGSIAGICNSIVSHPLDTVQVRMQTSTNSFKTTLNLLFNNEGLLSFYKGITPRITSIPLINAIVFSVYESTSRLIQEDVWWKPIVAGAAAGSANTLFVGPVELIKIRLQMQNQSKKDLNVQGPLQCARKIFQEGGIRGLYKGMFTLQLRELTGYSAQFYLYENTKNSLKFLNFNSFLKENNFDLLVSGGISGIACWVLSYPFDVIKTNIQSDQYSIYRKKFCDGGFLDCYSKIVREEGRAGLFKGVSACVLRAFIANGVGFWGYETSLKYLNTSFGKQSEEGYM